MSKKIILNYPGVLRAFNRVDAYPDNNKEKKYLLNTLSCLIDKTIQRELECIDKQKYIEKIIKVNGKEAEKLLKALEKNKIELYNNYSNKEILFRSK